MTVMRLSNRIILGIQWIDAATFSCTANFFLKSLNLPINSTSDEDQVEKNVKICLDFYRI